MKRMAATLLGVVMMTSPGLAEDFPAGRVISGVSGDWNTDGRGDLALLVAAPEDGSDDALLYLYLGDADHQLLRPVSMGDYSIWGNTSLDSLFGQDPTLTALASGSIAVTSENSGVGRSRWRQTVTIAWREGRFIVAGFAYDWYDTLDIDNPQSNGSCDYNLLNGKFILNGKSGKTAAKTISIADWDDMTGINLCGVN